MNRSHFPELTLEGRAHFVGIAGAGMCALAELVMRNGGEVSGSDLNPNSSSDALVQQGARVWKGHSAEYARAAAVVVISAAIPADHPEVWGAEQEGIPVLKRAQALGEWVNRSTVVAISGTHGKTSTTAMATEMLSAGDRDPTGIIGGTVESWGGNLRFGGNDLFVVEADEYDRSFHSLRPTVAVVTNVEADHLDVYGDLEGVYEGFRTFLDAVAHDGRVAACGDDHGAARLLPGLGDRAYTYGLNAGAQLRGVDVSVQPGGSRFRVMEEGRDRGELNVRVPGVHNVRNALGAAAAARYLGMEWADIREGLKRFTGVGRRFELLGEAAGVMVVDDYAHHPTEVRATLQAARMAYPERRLVAVFQPHLFSRTLDMATQFGKTLAAADRLWVTDVYPAREAPIAGVTGALVANAASAAGARDVRYHPDVDSLADEVASTLAAGDLCLTLGAGSIEHSGARILAALGGHDA